MKKYFVTSDVHGFCSILKNTLEINGFDINNEDHILVSCGDLFDRGGEAVELLNFLKKIPKRRLVLVKGNHCDLMEDCLFQLEQRVNISMHHWSNGTVDTIEQLTGVNKYDLACGLYNFREIKEKMSDYFELVKDAVDYFEIGDYILVHGWVPTDFKYKPTLVSDKGAWEKARWDNGMKMADLGAIIPNKTIICGHYHTGWGHKNIHNICLDEFDCFDIYKDKGIIALDSCVAYSHKLNILVIEEE